MQKRAIAALGVSWLALAGGALAQEAPQTDADRAARIQALEERLADLETQLNDLKESTAADSSDIRRVQTQAPQVTINNGRPTIASADGNFRFALRGLAQFDVATYLQDDDAPQDLSAGGNFRRARIGFEGTAFRTWNYALTYEAGGSGSEAAGLQQAWLEYAGWKPFGLTAPVRFRAGAFAVENTLEGATSNSDQLFLERPSIAEVVRSQFGGDGRNAFGVYANGDRLNLSLIATGSTLSNADLVNVPAPPAGTTSNVNDEAFGYVARVGALVLRSTDYSVHLGANYSATVQFADPSLAGTSPGIQLRDRPELRVDAPGTRLVDTGALTAENANAYGIELAGQWNNFFLASEWLNIDVDRPGATRDPSFDGYYVQGAWTITGEKRAWNAVNGGYGGIRPDHPLNVSEGHWGAFELAGRYSVLNLNDNEGVFGAATPSGGVRGGEQTISTLGLNWYPNQTVRFLLDLQDVNIDRLNGAGAQIGQDYQAIALRSQVSF